MVHHSIQSNTHPSAGQCSYSPEAFCFLFSRQLDSRVKSVATVFVTCGKTFLFSHFSLSDSRLIVSFRRFTFALKTLCFNKKKRPVTCYSFSRSISRALLRSKQDQQPLYRLPFFPLLIYDKLSTVASQVVVHFASQTSKNRS